MTEQEAIDELIKINQDVDIESEHEQSDKLIFEFLESNGYKDLAKTLLEISKNWWYA